jgi:hypothetical protein
MRQTLSSTNIVHRSSSADRDVQHRSNIMLFKHYWLG